MASVVDISMLRGIHCRVGSQETGSILPNETEINHLCSEIARRLLEDSYLHVSGHFLDNILIRQFGPAEHFFRGSIESKLQAVSKDKARRGYSPQFSENFASLVGKVGPNDAVEKFRCGPLLTASEKELNAEYFGTKSGRVYFYENEWGGTSAEFQEFTLNWYRMMDLLSLDLLWAMATGLGISPRYFMEQMKLQTSIMSINHYPALQGEISEDSDNIIRVAEHTDVSVLTLVYQTSPGLQIYSKNSESWINPIFCPGTLLVHVGDCLQYWSQNLLKSTLHRVINQAPSESEGDRMSIAYFATPKYDTILTWPGPASEEEIRVDSKEGFEQAESKLSYDIWRKKKIANSISVAKRK